MITTPRIGALRHGYRHRQAFLTRRVVIQFTREARARLYALNTGRFPMDPMRAASMLLGAHLPKHSEIVALEAWDFGRHFGARIKLPVRAHLDIPEELGQVFG